MQFWHDTVVWHSMRQELMYRSNKSTSEGHGNITLDMHLNVELTGLLEHNTATIGWVTKLAIVTFDMQEAWSRIQKPTFLLHKLVAHTRMLLHLFYFISVKNLLWKHRFCIQVSYEVSTAVLWRIQGLVACDTVLLI